MEVLQFKELGVNIRSFISMKSDDHSETFSDFLNRFKASLKNEIELKEQLLFRIDELTGRMETCKYNVGNYWIRKRHPFIQIPLLEAKND